MMKKLTIRLTALFVGVLGFTACDFYDFEQIQPIDAVDASLAITDRQSATAAIAGVYDELQDGTLAFDGYLSLWQYFSDECIWTGTFPTREEFDVFNVTTANGTMSAVWADYYDAINVANNVLEILPTVEDATIDDAFRNSTLAEARMARAFAYFHLAQGWDEVPLVLSPTRGVGEELNVPKNSYNEVMDQVIADAEFARDNLGASSLGFNPGAANALLARVHLVRGNYGAAATAATAAIGADYDATADAYLDDEIFYLNFIPTDGNSIAFFYAPANLNGRLSISPSADLVASYEEGDARFEMSIAFDGGAPYGIKYDDFATSSGSQSDPLYFFRKAEMVLVLAETNARDGNFGEASRWINQIRNRAGLGDVTLTADNYLDAILQERFVELAMEGGHRLWDLRRTDRAISELGPLGYDACDDVWPLPQSDIDRNPNLQQNNCCNC